MHNTSGTVVVVDDEPDILDLICSVLEDEGYRVICLKHPVQTDDLKRQEAVPHLFMLDIMLPAMSGIELAERLRQDGFEDTPMIAMSASPTMLAMAEQSELFHGSLGKPFDIDALVETVENYVKTRPSCGSS